MVLPKPDRKMGGRYLLDDGSIVYPSGVEKGKFFLWVHDGDVRVDGGKMVSDGHIVLDSHGPVYFRSPELAMVELERIALIRKQ